VNYLKKLDASLQDLQQTVINRVKLSRPGVFSSFGETFREPNFGPFPQYNIEIEDVPIEEQLRSLPPERRYESSTRSTLVRLLENSTNELVRLQTVVQNPRSKKNSSPKWALVKGSFFQDHEQYIEDNPPPFQEIIIHPESVVPDGGNAPLTPATLSKTQILNLNATADNLELTALMAQEVAMMKTLSAISR
jgi:hypothetical protein